MLTIPAIDILNSKIVRLKKGEFDQVTTYENTVFEQAQMFDEVGLKRIHCVDLKGSKSGEMRIISEIKKIKSHTNLEIQVGGGIRTYNDVKNLVNSGIDYFVIGSMTITDKPTFEKIVNDFGPERIIVAADVKGKKVRIAGWTEETNVTIDSHIGYCIGLGLRQFLCTDIDRDGLLEGANIEFYERLKTKYSDAFIIASGGISGTDDLNKLREKKIDAVVVGRAYYEGRITLKDLVTYAK